MKNLLLTTIFSGLLFCANAQEQSSKTTLRPKVSKTNIYLGIAMAQINSLQLNRVLEENGMSTLGETFFGSNLGLNVYKNRFGIAFESGLLTGLSRQKGNDSRINTISGRLGVNYLLIEDKFFLLAINANYSGCYHIARVYSKNENNISSGNLNSANGGILEFSNSSHNVGAALCMSYMIGRQTSILRLGYDYSLSSNKWHVSNSSIQDFPKEKFSGFYLALTLILKSCDKK